jgi:hypothetical protein
MVFAECNDRVFTAERMMIDAEDDAADMLERDTFDMLETIQRGEWEPNEAYWTADRFSAMADRSTALHEFILNARYERDVREGRIVLH